MMVVLTKIEVMLLQKPEMTEEQLLQKVVRVMYRYWLLQKKVRLEVVVME